MKRAARLKQPTMTPEAYARWQLEMQLVNKLLRQYEDAQRAVLTDLGVPTPERLDAEHLDDMLSRGPRLASRQRTRAVYALHGILAIRETRRYIALGAENARLAAAAALRAGVFVGDAALKDAEVRIRRASQKAGGTARGQTLSKQAASEDAVIRQLHRRWISSDALQSEYRSPSSYIASKTRLHLRKVRRRLRELRLPFRDSS